METDTLDLLGSELEKTMVGVPSRYHLSDEGVTIVIIYIKNYVVPEMLLMTGMCELLPMIDHYI